MTPTLHQVCEETVRAAIIKDQAFSNALPRLMQESQGAPPAELAAALPRLAEGIAQAPPNLGGWLAVVAGSWIEAGADPDVVGAAVVERMIEVSAASARFAGAWKDATGGEPPDPRQAEPSQQVLDTIRPEIEGDGIAAMMSWFSMEQFALSACTVLAKSPRLRATLPDRDFKAFVTAQVAPYCGQMEYVRDLLRVLEGERLLILDRETRGGWTVTISGIGDNFQLHTLLGGALVGKPGGMPGHTPDPHWIDSFTSGDAAPGTPPVQGWWNLADARGEWIWNEGVPADIHAVGTTRVVVLDPPPYTRSWSPGRRFPMMSGSLTVEGLHTAEDLGEWWTHVAEAKGPNG